MDRGYITCHNSTDMMNITVKLWKGVSRCCTYIYSVLGKCRVWQPNPTLNLTLPWSSWYSPHYHEEKCCEWQYEKNTTETSLITLTYLWWMFTGNKYQEAACEAQITALQECCKKWHKVSGCCAGVKPKNTSTSTASPKTRSSSQK